MLLIFNRMHWIQVFDVLGIQRFFLSLVIAPKARFLDYFLLVHLRQEIFDIMDFIAQYVSGPLL